MTPASPRVSDDASDKRLYRRVDVVIPFRFTVSDRAAAEACRVESDSSSVDAVEHGDQPQAMLTRIEQKLDRLLKQLEPDERFAEMMPISVNLSGAGVRFASDIPLQPGTILEMTFILPYGTPVRILAFGEVTRSRKVGRPQGAAYETAVAFLVLSDKDRELMIRYTFQVQHQ